MCPQKDPITGRFLPGNKAAKGRGRPKRVVEEQYLKTLRRVVSQKKWAALVEVIYQKALTTGDVAAFRALAEYAIGRPTVYVKGEVVQVEMSIDDWKEMVAERWEEVNEL